MNGLRHYLRASCDITRSCNLRCRFCFNDFSKPAFNMTEEIFADILKVVKYVPPVVNMDGQGFYFSCLWEPSLNPDFIKLLQMIPPQYKDHIFFTSNFAKKFDEETFRQLAKANVEYINISIETFERETYKKLTGGTDFNYEMFMENLETIARVFRETEGAPKLRFISMALKSNLHELKTIIERGQTELGGYVSEIRTPFFGEYLTRFADELLSKEEIDGLKKMLDASDKRIVYALEEVQYPPKKSGDEHAGEVASKLQEQVEENGSSQANKEEPSGDELPALVLAELPDYFYDMQIESTGDIFWRGDGVWHRYDQKADLDQVLTDGLVRLKKKEAARHELAKENISQYMQLKKSLLTRTDFVVDNTEEDDGFVSVRGWAGVRGLDSKDILKILELKSDADGQVSYYLCGDEPRADVGEAVSELYQNAGYRVFLDKEKLAGCNFTARMYFYDKKANRIVHRSRNCRKIRTQNEFKRQNKATE